ncbi:hypothetical protein XF24_01014 [candidate division SR1 bacterium Aalborg_AAW-1]|nr:hypothetical protein XF24_01014 [candidate division SR1 bacterium Aalborg_AAW-1]
MGKLPLGTLQNIPREEVKKLVFSHDKDHIRDEISSLFSKDKKDDIVDYKISLDHFKEIKNTLDDMQGYNNLCKEYYINISYDSLKCLIGLYETSDDFFWLSHNYDVREVLREGKVHIIKNIIGLCKSIEEFEKFCRNRKMRLMFKIGNEKNIETVIGLCKTIEELELLLDNESVSDILSYGKEKNIKAVIGLCKTIKEFELLCDNFWSMKKILQEGDGNVVEYIISLYDIKTVKDFKVLCSCESIKHILTHGKRKNLEYFIGLYNIKTPEELELLFTKKSIQDAVVIRERNLEHVLGLYNIKTINDFEEIWNNENLQYVLIWSIEKSLDLIIGLCKTKERFKILCDNKNIRQILKDGGAENMKFLKKISYSENMKETLYSYLDKRIFLSKDNIRILFKSKFDMNSENSRKLFEYYLQYKPKHLIKMVEMLSAIQFFGLDISLDQFKTLDDFKDKEGMIQQDELKENFLKILQLNGINEKNIQKNSVTFDNLCKSKNNEEGLEKLLMENLIIYIDRLYHHKLKTALLSHIKSNLTHEEKGDIDVHTIDDEKYENTDFLEACKMSWSPKYNKHQINKLLMDYLVGKFDIIDDMNQYDTPKNKNWLENNLNDEQQKIRLLNNRQEFIIDDKYGENEGKENIQIRLHNHVEVAKNKIKEFNQLGYEYITEFSSPGSLVEYYNTIIKKDSIGLKEKNENLFADLKLQIDEIQGLFQTYKSKKVNKVIIERELNPLRSLMMGNRVDGSCLSFYSTVGNYYSAISNTIDINKGVYYLRDEHGALLGRCLITIGNDKKLSRYKMYYNGNVDAPLDDYFDEYTIQLAKNMKLELNGEEDEVRNIECEERYQDGIQDVKYKKPVE